MAKRQSPTPTLAQLRKLAKQKGGTIGSTACADFVFDGEDVCMWWIAYQGNLNKVKECAFAALRALPDKVGPRG